MAVLHLPGGDIALEGSDGDSLFLEAYGVDTSALALLVVGAYPGAYRREGTTLS